MAGQQSIDLRIVWRIPEQLPDCRKRSTNERGERSGTTFRNKKGSINIVERSSACDRPDEIVSGSGWNEQRYGGVSFLNQWLRVQCTKPTRTFRTSDDGDACS